VNTAIVSLPNFYGHLAAHLSLQWHTFDQVVLTSHAPATVAYDLHVVLLLRKKGFMQTSGNQMPPHIHEGTGCGSDGCLPVDYVGNGGLLKLVIC
jgi:hypothetical protein